MNGKNQKRGILQVLLAAIVAAIVCSTNIVGAQVRPAQCEEYTRAAHITLTRGRNVSILTMLAMAWEGLTDAEGTGYLNRGETPRRVLLRSAWPIRGASITPSWAPPAASVPLLTMGQLVLDNPGRWTTRHHKIFIVDLPESVHITRSLSVSVTENVRELPATPVQIGYRRDRVDVTTRGRLVAQPSATATTVEQLFTADASWFHLPADAVTQRTYSNWKVETLTGFSDRSRTFSIRRIGARRALQRSCEALPRVDSVITGEDRAQLAELLVELDGVGSDPDAQIDLQSAVTAAHARVVSALSQQLRPDREAIASANAGRDGWQNAAVKNEASAKSWRKVFEGYRALTIRNVIIASVLLFVLFAILVAIILLRKPTVAFRDSTPPDGSRNTPDPDHRDSMQPSEGVVVHIRPDPALLNAKYDEGVAAGKAFMTFVDLNGSELETQKAVTDALNAAYIRGENDGKASAPTPQQIEGMIGTARQAGYGDGFTAGATSRNGEVKNLTDRIGDLETAARATGIRHEAKIRELEAERDGLSARLQPLIILVRDIYEIVFERQLALADGNVQNPKGVADQLEVEIELLRTGISGKLQLAYTALREIKASGGKARIVKIARRGLGEKVEETGARPQAREYNDRMTRPGHAPGTSGVMHANAPEAADDHPTEKIETTEELLAAVLEEVDVVLEEDIPSPAAAPAVPTEDYILATRLFHAAFRRLFDRLATGEREGTWMAGTAGVAHAVGQALAVLRNTLEDYGYEAEAISLVHEAFRGCPEIVWTTSAGLRDRSHGGTTKLQDITPDGRTPQRLVLDRYCAIASFLKRVVSGETNQISFDPKAKAVFDQEMATLAEDLDAAGNKFARTALINGLEEDPKTPEGKQKQVRTTASRRATARGSDQIVAKSG